jgi:hypothetical protein
MKENDMKTTYCTIITAVLLWAVSSMPSAYGQQRSTVSPFGPAPTARNGRFDGEKFARTELYFGTAKPDGSAVTEAEFESFLDAQITPRFPEGLTLVSALGQFLNSSGVIIQENSKLLILLYPANLRKANNAKIEEIRNAYKDLFQQESVLRSDRCCEEVGFRLGTIEYVFTQSGL